MITMLYVAISLHISVAPADSDFIIIASLCILYSKCFGNI